MDINFAAQAVATERSVKYKGKLDCTVHQVPKEVDEVLFSIRDLQCPM